MDIVWEQKSANFKRVRSLVAAARPEPGSLIVVPEMFACGFTMNASGMGEKSDGATEQFLKELAIEVKCAVLGGTIASVEDGKGRNEAIAFSADGTLLARYAKIHPFSLGGESDHYQRGKELVFFEWNGLKTVPFICYDLRFPEIFREAARLGGEFFVVIANWPAKREQHWVTLLQARAIENQAWVAGVNRSGSDPQHVYPGRSVIINPHGQINVGAGASECIISADVDTAFIRQWREQFPALRDMHWEPRR